eukprot:ANDGO_07628.mRNA.1 Polycystin-2
MAASSSGNAGLGGVPSTPLSLSSVPLLAPAPQRMSSPSFVKPRNSSSSSSGSSSNGGGYGLLHRRNIRPSLVSFIVSFEKKALRQKATKNLLIYIPFLVLVFFYVLGSRSFEQAFFARDNLEEVIIREPWFNLPAQNVWDTFADISSFEDWFDWATQPLVTELWPVSSVRYNVPIGAVRLRQFRVSTSDCSIIPEYNPSASNPYFDPDCYPEASDATLMKGGGRISGYQDCAEAPATPIWGQSNIVYPCGGYIVDISLPNTTYADALAVFQQLKQGLWLDQHTAGVVVEFFTYNPNVDVFISNKYFVEYHFTGAVIPQAIFRPFKLKLAWFVSPWETTVLMLQIVFVLYTFYYLVDWVLRLVHAMRFARSKLEFFTFWNIYDSLFFLFFLSSFISRAVVIGRIYASSFNINGSSYPDLDEIVNNYVINAQLDGLLAVLCFLRTFQFLRLNDRLNLLGRTLSEAVGDLVGFLVMFVIVFLGFASMAFIVYGPELDEYRTYARSISACFFILLGDSDYESLLHVHRILTPFFYFGFMLLVFFVLFNVFLAIVNDSYQKATESSSSQSVGTQLLKAFRRWKESVLAWWHRKRRGSSSSDGDSGMFHSAVRPFPKGRLSKVDLALRLRTYFLPHYDASIGDQRVLHEGPPIFRSELALRVKFALSGDATQQQLEEILRLFDEYDATYSSSEQDALAQTPQSPQDSSPLLTSESKRVSDLLGQIEERLSFLQSKIKTS